MSSKIKDKSINNSIPLSQHIAYLIKITEHEIRKRMDAELKEISLTVPQYAVLIRLEEFPGLSNADLARKSFVTPQTMNQIILTLEKGELIVRNNHSRNGRIQQTHLTDEGEIILKKAHKIVYNISESLFENLSDDEKISLSNCLNKIKIDL